MLNLNPMKSIKTALIISVLALAGIASAKMLQPLIEPTQIVGYITTMRNNLNVYKVEDGTNICYISFVEFANGNTGMAVNQSISCVKK